jgi:hypothetical protein
VGAEQNETLKIDLENFFLSAKQNYTDSIVEVTTIRNDRRFSIDDALKCISEDSVELPALPTTTTTTTTTTTSGTTTLPPPVVELHWADFPNSQDSLWSQKHPECPQGPPCFCDCKCRGGPPQNFVESMRGEVHQGHHRDAAPRRDARDVGERCDDRQPVS